MASNGGTSPEQTGSHAGAPASAVALRPTSLAAARAKRKTGGGRGGHHKKGKKTENVLSAVLEIPRGSPTSGAAGSPVFFKTFLCSPCCPTGGCCSCRSCSEPRARGRSSTLLTALIAAWASPLGVHALGVHALGVPAWQPAAPAAPMMRLLNARKVFPDRRR